MGYISGVLFLVGTGLIVAKKYRAAFVVMCFSGLFAWGTFMVKS
jgi:hypothetical protein